MSNDSQQANEQARQSAVTANVQQRIGALVIEIEDLKVEVAMLRQENERLKSEGKT